MWTNFRFSLTNVTSFFFNLHSPLQIPGLPLMNDTGPASALQPWTSACHPRPATPPPSPRLPPHPPPSPPPPPWSPLTAAGALSHTSSRGWVQVVHARGRRHIRQSPPQFRVSFWKWTFRFDFTYWIWCTAWLRGGCGALREPRNLHIWFGDVIRKKPYPFHFCDLQALLHSDSKRRRGQAS